MENFTEYSEMIHRFLAQGPFRDKKHAVTTISRTLGISQTSAYNKLGDRCRFSLEEFSLLCQKFQLSADAFLLVTSSSAAHFTCRRLETEFTATSLVSRWIHMAETWIPKLSRGNAIMAVFPQTIPFHQICGFPQLIYLTLFYHLENDNSTPNAYFPEPFVQNYAVKLACQQLTSSLQKIQCMELVHTNMLQAILGMYEELCDSGVICNPAHHHAIREEVFRLVLDFEQKTEQKSQVLHNNQAKSASQVALCHVPGPSDWMIFQSDDMIPYSRCHSMTNHTFESKDPNLYNTLDKAFQKKWQEATIISGSGAVCRRQFFQKLTVDIQQTFTKAKSVLLHPAGFGPQPHPAPDSTPAGQVQSR